MSDDPVTLPAHRPSVSAAHAAAPTLPAEGFASPSSEAPAGPWDPSRLPVVDPDTYSVQGAVAEGGIGRVVRASDRRLDREVALKELAFGGAGAEERFVREAVLTARLQHPSIVPIYEAGRWPGGAPFYAMKLVSGRTLAEHIAEAATLEQRIALLPHVVAAADAVAYAHSRRIIHRDLKPHNILVGEFGETQVIDWGLAKEIDEPEAERPDEAASGAPRHAARASSAQLTVVGAVVGTPAYMPPEQAAGQPVDARADVYALGAILYHLLAGAPPYAGPDLKRLLRKVIESPPPSLAAADRAIPEDLVAIVDKAMARAPEGRYPTARELAEDLRALQTGRIVSARRYSARALVLRAIRRHRALFAVIAAAIVVLGATGAWALARVLAERSRAEAMHRSAEEAQRRATERADALTLLLAETALERDPNEAMAWLRTLSPAFDRWGDARRVAADARSAGLSRLLAGHGRSVNVVAVSPDGRLVAAAGDDHTVRVFDLRSGEALRVFDAHEDEVWSVAFTPDSAEVLSGGKDRSARRFDVRTGASSALRDLQDGVLSMTPGPPGAGYIVVGGATGEAIRWDKDGARRSLLPPTEPWRRLAVAADGRHVAGADAEGRLRVLVEVETGKAAPLPDLPVDLRMRPLLPALFAEGGATLLAAGPDGVIRALDIAAGEARVIGTHPARVTAFALSGDERRLASGGEDGSLMLWDLAGGASRALASHQGLVRALRFSPDGALLASGSFDHAAHLHDLRTGTHRRLRGARDAIPSLAFSPDGATLAVASWDHGVRLHATRDTPDRVLGAHAAPIQAFDVSPAGDRAVTGDEEGRLSIWRLDEPEAAPITWQAHRGPARAAAFSPDGRWLVSSGDDGLLRRWDAEGREEGRFELHPGGAGGAGGAVSTVRALGDLAVAADGSRIAVACAASEVHVVDLAGPRKVFPGPSGPIEPAFSPDGRWLAAVGGEDRAARLWDLQSGEGQELEGHTEALQSLAFFADSRRLATGARDHRVRIWDLLAGESRVLPAGGFGVTHILLSPDGATMVTLNSDTTVRVWRVEDGSERHILRGHEGLTRGGALSPDGAMLATVSDDHTARLWDLASGQARVLRGHTAAVRRARFAGSGERLLTVGDDRTIRLWADDLSRDGAALRAWIEQWSNGAGTR